MYVNTGEIRTLAGNVNSLNDKITIAFDSVLSAMTSLNNSWSGAASESALSVFNKINDNCINIQRLAIADYSKFLTQRVSAGYELVETANKSLSEAFK